MDCKQFILNVLFMKPLTSYVEYNSWCYSKSKWARLFVEI